MASTQNDMQGAPDEQGRANGITRRLDASREELRDILRPKSRRGDADTFPRSATMRALVDGRGKAVLTAISLALVAARAGRGGRLAKLGPLLGLVSRSLLKKKGRAPHRASRS